MGFNENLISIRTECTVKNKIPAKELIHMLHTDYDKAKKIILGLTHADINALMHEPNSTFIGRFESFYTLANNNRRSEGSYISVPSSFIYAHEKQLSEIFAEVQNHKLIQNTTSVFGGTRQEAIIFENSTPATINIGNYDRTGALKTDPNELNRVYRYFQYLTHIQDSNPDIAAHIRNKMIIHDKNSFFPLIIEDNISKKDATVRLPAILMQMDLFDPSRKKFIDDIYEKSKRIPLLKDCITILDKYKWLSEKINTNNNHPSDTINGSQITYLEKLLSGYFPKDSEIAQALLGNFKLSDTLTTGEINELSTLMSDIIERGLFSAAQYILNSASPDIRAKTISGLSKEAWMRMYENKNHELVKPMITLIHQSIVTANTETSSELYNLFDNIDMLEYFDDTLGLEQALDLHTAFPGAFNNHAITSLRKELTASIENELKENHLYTISFKGKLVNDILEEYVSDPSAFIKLTRKNFPLLYAYYTIMSDDQIKRMVEISDHNNIGLIEYMLAIHLYQFNAGDDQYGLWYSTKKSKTIEYTVIQHTLQNHLGFKEYGKFWNPLLFSTKVNLHHISDGSSLRREFSLYEKMLFITHSTSMMLNRFIPYLPATHSIKWPTDLNISFNNEQILIGLLINRRENLINLISTHMIGLINIKELIKKISEYRDSALRENINERALMFLRESPCCFNFLKALFRSSSAPEVLSTLNHESLASHIKPSIKNIIVNQLADNETILHILNQNNKVYFKKYMEIIGQDNLILMSKSRYAVYALFLNQKEKDLCIEKYIGFDSTISKDRTWNDDEKNLYNQLIAVPPAYSDAPAIPAPAAPVYLPITPSQYQNEISSTHIDTKHGSDSTSSANSPIPSAPIIHAPENDQLLKLIEDLRNELKDQKALSQSLLGALNHISTLSQGSSSKEPQSQHLESDLNKLQQENSELKLQVKNMKEEMKHQKKIDRLTLAWQNKINKNNDKPKRRNSFG